MLQRGHEMLRISDIGEIAMIQTELDQYYRCRLSVEKVLARYNWVLLERKEFIERVMACIESGEVNEPWAAAIHVYCRCLYVACSGGEGYSRQDIGFRELQRYLYDLSRREAPELSTDERCEVVNDALLRVWQRMKEYRSPGAFLANAAFELRNAIRPWWSRQPTLSFEHVIEQPNRSQSVDPELIVLDDERRRRVRDCFDSVLLRHPRARHQLEAVWLKYIAGLDDAAISAHLGKPVASIHVLRSRGLSHLRNESSWQHIAQEFDL